MLLLAFPTWPPARARIIHHYGGRLAPVLALLVVACGGAVQSDDVGCLDANCGGATQSSAGGSALPATTGTGATTAANAGSFNVTASGGNSVVPIDPGDGGTSSGGASALPVSVIVTQDVPQTSVDQLAGVHFSVTVDPPATTSVFYDFPAVPPTVAAERNFCGYLTTHIFTCSGNQAGCLSITIDSMLHATARFTDSDSLTHELVGYVSAVKAPLSPLSNPPEHSLAGEFLFTSSDGIPLEIIGSFSVLIDNGTSATGTYLIIC